MNTDKRKRAVKWLAAGVFSLLMLSGCPGPGGPNCPSYCHKPNISGFCSDCWWW